MHQNAVPPVPALLSEEQRRRMLRRALAAALRNGRHRAVVAAEAETVSKPPPEVGVWLAMAVYGWWLGATIGDQLDVRLVLWPVIGLGAFMAVGLIVGALNRLEALGALFLVAIAVGSVLVEINDGRLWLTHIGPALIATGIGLATRTIGVQSARDASVAAAAVARSAPLLAPLALVVLVLPALSADLWRAAAALDAIDIGVLLLVTAVPLLAVVAAQLLAELSEVLRTRSRRLAEDPDRDERTREMLRARLDSEAFEVLDFVYSLGMRRTWPRHADVYAPFIAAAERDVLRRPILARLTACVLIAGASLTVYLYVVLAVIVDPEVARAWSGAEVPMTRIAALGLHILLPGGPYLHVVGLLGALATATFLAFALLEERFSIALGDALVRMPADQLLVLALPYLQLREERVGSMDTDFDEWDPAAIRQAEEHSEVALPS